MDEEDTIKAALDELQQLDARVSDAARRGALRVLDALKGRSRSVYRSDVPYLFYDLETNGLDPQRHRIIEIAAVAVDPNLVEVGKFNVVINEPQIELSPFIQEMHQKSGLLKERAGSDTTLAQAEDAFCEFLAKNYSLTKKLVMAGHSPHGVDLPFTRAHLPRAAEFFSHRLLDTGMLVRALVEITGYPFDHGKTDEHRALPDALGALDEYRRYVNVMRNTF